jgi:hypothetical protein
MYQNVDVCQSYLLVLFLNGFSRLTTNNSCEIGNPRPAVGGTHLLFHNQLHEIKQKPVLRTKIVENSLHDHQALT